jgi:pimeloyl-ACP methyl ester carboxylesterase
MGKWLLRIVIGLFGLVLAAVIVSVVVFQVWLFGHDRNLIQNSEIAQTKLGPIEYATLGKGPAVLVIHGTPGGYDGPLAKLKLTSAEQDGFRYIVPSRPGYLRTSISIGRTPVEQADALAVLIDSLGIQTTAVVGISGGGPAALQFALRYPDRCSALVLEAALVRNYKGPAPRLPVSSLGAYLRDLLFYLFQNAGIAPYQAKNPSDPMITKLARAELYGIIPYGRRKIGTANDLVQENNLNDLPLENITCPTLILHGTADTSAPIEDAEYAHRQISNSQLVEIKGQDHMMSIVDHQKIDSLRTAFLRDHSEFEDKHQPGPNSP